MSNCYLHCAYLLSEMVLFNCLGDWTPELPWLPGNRVMIEGHLLFVPYSVDYTEGLLWNQEVF